MPQLKAPQEKLLVTIAGEEVDLSPVIPFKVRTWRELKAKGIDPIIVGRLSMRQELDMTPLIEIAVTAVRLARPALTVEAIEDDLTFGDVTRITKVVLGSEGTDAPVDRPTSTASSPLPSGGDGVQPMSSI